MAWVFALLHSAGVLLVAGVAVGGVLILIAHGYAGRLKANGGRPLRAALSVLVLTIAMMAAVVLIPLAMLLAAHFVGQYTNPFIGWVVAIALFFGAMQWWSASDSKKQSSTPKP